MKGIFKTTFLVLLGTLCLGVGRLHAEEPDSICGNGKIEGYEQCDDGNQIDGDGCDHLCLRESKYSVAGVNNTIVIQVQCGNGKLEGGESCDDGNLVDGDGCDHFCQKEVLHMTPVTTINYQIGCGNGHLDAGEECDDGNLANGDGCNENCQKEVPLFPVDTGCGNAVVEKGETCDDGNLVDGDGCSATCQIETPAPPATTGENPATTIQPHENSVDEHGTQSSIGGVSQITSNEASDAVSGSGCSLTVVSAETTPLGSLLALGGFLSGILLTRKRR